VSINRTYIPQLTSLLGSVNFYFQELLKLFKISPDEKSQKKNIWVSFPRDVQEIMVPLLSSYYKNSIGPNVQMPHPIIGFVNCVYVLF
jgi:hypothetical protein